MTAKKMCIDCLKLLNAPICNIIGHRPHYDLKLKKVLKGNLYGNEYWEQYCCARCEHRLYEYWEFYDFLFAPFYFLGWCVIFGICVWCWIAEGLGL